MVRTTCENEFAKFNSRVRLCTPLCQKPNECACVLACLLAHVLGNLGVNLDANFTSRQAKLGGKAPNANSINQIGSESILSTSTPQRRDDHIFTAYLRTRPTNCMYYTTKQETCTTTNNNTKFQLRNSHVVLACVGVCVCVFSGFWCNCPRGKQCTVTVQTVQ